MKGDLQRIIWNNLDSFALHDSFILVALNEHIELVNIIMNQQSIKQLNYGVSKIKINLY